MKQQEQPAQLTRKQRGFYTKWAAELNQQDPSFKRSKKNGIKKDNRMVCKEARLRKNKYLSDLEKRNKDLLAENQHLRSQIDRLNTDIATQNAQYQQEISNLRDHLENVKISGGTDVDQRTQMLAKEFKQLVTSIKKQEKDEISRSLCVLRSRFGVSGRERKKWLEESMLRMIELSMPLHFRVLIENVEDSFKFFQLLGGSHQMRTFRLHFDQTQKSILRDIKPRIKKAKDNFNRIFQKLHQFWTELTNYSEKAQKIIDTIEQNLDPVFVGSLLINLDRNKTNLPHQLLQERKQKEQWPPGPYGTLRIDYFF